MDPPQALLSQANEIVVRPDRQEADQPWQGRAKAWDEYHRIMAKRQQAEPSSDEAVKVVVNRYLGWIKDNRSPATYDKCRRHLRRFVLHVGQNLKVRELKRHHVQRWIDDEYAGKSSTYQNTAMTTVVGALNWAAEFDFIPENPLRGLKKPARKVREFFLSETQWQEILAAIPDQEFRDYFTFAVSCGTRPQETRIDRSPALRRGQLPLDPRPGRVKG